jgi:hypothetical protein
MVNKGHLKPEKERGNDIKTEKERQEDRLMT